MSSRREFLRLSLLAPGCLIVGCENGARHQRAGAPEVQRAGLGASPSEEGGASPPRRKQSALKKGAQRAPFTDEIPKLGTKLELSEKEWRERLTPEQFNILRKGGTEPAWTGAYLKNKEEGVYHCAGCNNPLFSSKTKFRSGTGWPSFYEPIHPKRVLERSDGSYGMKRTEVLCAHCEGHQGHVFNDGPEPTGLRYCINSLALYFRPA